LVEAGVRDRKSLFGVGSVLLPVLYCAGLLYYFLDFSGSMQEAEAIGLGPTVLGLGVIGLLFSIPMIMKAGRLVGRARRPDDDEPDTGRTVDADAAIARYKARQAEERDNTPVAPPPPRSPAPRSGFGRRNR
jgi:hypothetical protein